MSDFFRTLCSELADELEGFILDTGLNADLLDLARAALAEPDHFVDVPKMVEPAERELAELVELLRAEAADDETGDHMLWMTPADARRAADLLERLAPQPVPEGPSDAELLELMPQQFRDDLATVSRLASYGTPVEPGIYRVSLNTGALDFARAVLARWGRP